MRAICVCAVAMLMILPASAEPELKGSPAELTTYLSGIPRTVRATGEAELRIEADQARVIVKISTESKSLEDALKKNSGVRSRIAEELKTKGIPPENILGARFASLPQYGLFSEKAKSYRVENYIRVAVRNEGELRIVAAAIDAHQDVSYQGIDFRNSNEAELKQKVLGQACEAAVAKKKLYEDKLAVKLVIREFTEEMVGKESPHLVRGRRGKLASIANVQRDAYESTGEGDASPGEGGSQFDEITYRARVAVECELKKL